MDAHVSLYSRVDQWLIPWREEKIILKEAVLAKKGSPLTNTATMSISILLIWKNFLAWTWTEHSTYMRIHNTHPSAVSLSVGCVQYTLAIDVTSTPLAPLRMVWYVPSDIDILHSLVAPQSTGYTKIINSSKEFSESGFGLVVVVTSQVNHCTRKTIYATMYYEPPSAKLLSLNSLELLIILVYRVDNSLHFLVSPLHLHIYSPPPRSYLDPA